MQVADAETVRHGYLLRERRNRAVRAIWAR